MLKKLFLLILPLLFAACSNVNNQSILPLKVDTPARPAGQTDVLELRCEPIDTVNVAIIGLGNRGGRSVFRLSFIPTLKITAIADLQEKLIDNAQKTLVEQGRPKADAYTGVEDWKKICERPDIDLIIVNTQWDLHTPIAIYAMEHGKHVATEVPIAMTMDDCWKIINTAETTRRHCMMLENCNYDAFELATLNMAQQGKFGTIKHAEGAYIHDLRWHMFAEGKYWNSWRRKENAKNNGNLYPTHGLGPISHILNIHRGDRMQVLSSMSCNQYGMTDYATKKFGADSELAKADYAEGDMNTTIIRTIKGKTMMIQHDVISPRPYSRHHLISGTDGFAQKYPSQILAFDGRGHGALPKAKVDSLLKVYQHPIVTDEIIDLAKKVGGHGGMDFIMYYRLIYCLNHGLPLDQDVYDGVEWSCLFPLTQLSVKNGGAPVEIPDFTRGAWEKLKTVKYYMK